MSFSQSIIKFNFSKRLSLFTKRIFSSIIDFIILALFIAIVGFFVVGIPGTGSASPSGSMIGLFNTIVIFIYFVLQEGSKNNATIGKQIMGLRIYSLSGTGIRYGKAIARSLIKFIFLFPVFLPQTPLIETIAGFLMIIPVFGLFFILFTEKAQALHDNITKTLVLPSQPQEMGSATILK